MLRLAVIALLLANAGYYAWSQGLLKDWGFAPEEQAEPQRMNQQIRPETLQILRVNPSKTTSSSSTSSSPPPSPSTPGTATASADVASSAASSPPPADTAECLQAGVFDERQAEALRTAAAGLPQGSWALEPTPIAGRWMVYMGRFEDIETLDRKRAELRARLERWIDQQLDRHVRSLKELAKAASDPAAAMRARCFMCISLWRLPDGARLFSFI